MKHLITVIVMTFLLMGSISAHSVADSLRRLLPIVDGTEKVQILNDLSRASWSISTEQTIEYGYQALELALRCDDKMGEATARKNIGVGYSNMYKIKESLRYYDEALQIYQAIDNKEGEANVLNNIGVNYLDRDEYDTGLQYYLQSMKIYEEINDTSGIAASFVNIGTIYNILGKNDKALDYYKKSLNLFQILNDSSGAALCLNNLGNVYSEEKDYHKALMFYHECLELNRKINDKFGIGDALLNIGYAYDDLKDHDQALTHYLESFKIEMELKDTYGLSITTNNIGDLFRRLQNYEEASKYLNQSLIYSLEIGAKDMLMENYDCLSKLRADQMDFENALQYYKQYTAMKDSIFNEKSSNKIADMQTKYDTDKKEQENELLRKEKEVQQATINKQRTLTFSIGIGLMLMIGFAVFVIRAYNGKKKANRVLNKQKAKIEKQAGELKSANDKLIELDRFKEAMTGMIVHDLKNPLGAILNYSQARENISQNIIYQASLQMLNMVTNILDVQKFEDSKMNLEINDINLYQVGVNAIKQINFLSHEKGITIDNNIANNLTVSVDNDIIERVFVNLLTNSIKYTPQNGRIVLDSLAVEGDRVKVSVSDNGEGINEDNLKKVFEKFQQVAPKQAGKVRSTGLGLTFCKMAIESHGGRIWIESRPHEGTTFWFTVSLSDKASAAKPTPASVENTDIEFSNDEKILLDKYLAKFRELEIYEISDLRKTLRQINTNESIALEAWKDKIHQAVYTNNKDSYKKLIKA